MSVDLCRLERFVAEQCLDDAQVCVAVEKLGGKGVAKEMRVQSDAETSAGARYRIVMGRLPMRPRQEAKSGSRGPSEPREAR